MYTVQLWTAWYLRCRVQDHRFESPVRFLSLKKIYFMHFEFYRGYLCLTIYFLPFTKSSWFLSFDSNWPFVCFVQLRVDINEVVLSLIFIFIKFGRTSMFLCFSSRLRFIGHPGPDLKVGSKVCSCGGFPYYSPSICIKTGRFPDISHWLLAIPSFGEGVLIIVVIRIGNREKAVTWGVMDMFHKQVSLCFLIWNYI
jgi:hypothetical protein